MYVKVLSSVVAALIMTSCSVKVQPYYSEANQTYRSSSITTDIIAIAGADEELDYPAGFGVMTAVDNSALKYTLVVPVHEDKKAHGDPDISLYNFNHAAVLTVDTNRELLASVDSAIADWNVQYDESKARNISYLSSSESNSIDFHYQNGAKGEIAFVTIDSGEMYRHINDDDSVSVQSKTYYYEITTLSELKGFRYLLAHALKMIEEQAEITPIENNSTVADNNGSIYVDTNLTKSISDENSSIMVDTNGSMPLDTNLTTPASDENNSSKAVLNNSKKEEKIDTNTTTAQ